MNTKRWPRVCAMVLRPVALPCLLALMLLCMPNTQAQNPPVSVQPARPSLTVAVAPVVQYKVRDTLSAQGNVQAWQELIQGAQLAGVRLLSLQAQIGDVVKKDQVLARFDDEPVRADVAQAQALLTEAKARLDEAKQHADMLRKVADPVAVSALELNTALAAEKSAQARVQSAAASLDQQKLRLKYTVVRAIDHGVVSSRRATVGQVPNPGEELFRLVRQQRVEWHADLGAKDLPKIKLGAAVQVRNGEMAVAGRVRAIAPVLDTQNREAKVLVELPKGFTQGLRPGMYLRGDIILGERAAMMVPQSAVVQREGFSYVFVLDNKTKRVQQVKVTTGALQVNNLEILPNQSTGPGSAGLQVGQQVVKSGAAFLADSDLVKVVP